MKHEAMRWLVAGVTWCGLGLPVAMAQQAPASCDGVDAEGIREMRTLFQAERRYVEERDQYSRDSRAVGFLPAACADGSRAPVPGPDWVAGCHFAYQVSDVKGPPEPGFSALARGAAGTAAQDVTLRIGSASFTDISFWLERPESRRAVIWNECLPTGPFSLLESEGVEAMHHLFVSLGAFLRERDRYSRSFTELGFQPQSCTDGSRATAPGPDWVAGCHFAYQVTSVTGLPTPSFVATARGARGTPVENVVLRLGFSPPRTLSFWLERSGVRQSIAWDESLPTESGYAAQEGEGRAQTQSLYMSMRAFFQETDRYPSRIQELADFLPLSCGDGTWATGPEETWMGGCRFIYRIDTTGPHRFLVTARGVSGLVRGTRIQIDQDGTLTVTADSSSVTDGT